MKTTIDLPDELMIAAKKRAAEERTTLRVLFERALRRQLARRPGPSKPGANVRIRWVTVRGGLPPGLDLADRRAMQDWIQRNRRSGGR